MCKSTALTLTLCLLLLPTNLVGGGGGNCCPSNLFEEISKPAKILLIYVSPHLSPASTPPAPVPALLSASHDSTTVLHGFPLQAEIPIDKAHMIQKEQAEQNVPFHLVYYPTFLNPFHEFSCMLESGLSSKSLHASKWLPLLPSSSLKTSRGRGFGPEDWKDGHSWSGKGQVIFCHVRQESPISHGVHGAMGPGERTVYQSMKKLCVSIYISWNPDESLGVRICMPNLALLWTLLERQPGEI